MPLVPLTASVYFICPELQEPLQQLARSPIEPAPSMISSCRDPGHFSIATHFGYELSPSPKDTKFTPWRNVGGSRLASSDVQNFRPFAGISP